MLVQKEDFLRPDSKGSKESLRKSYNSLYSGLYGAEIPGLLNYVQYSEAFEIDPIRCVGSVSSDMKKAFPRMHNKFLIGCDYSVEVEKLDYAEHNLYQRPFQLTCAQVREVMEAMATGSFAKKFHALQQASTMSS